MARPRQQHKRDRQLNLKLTAREMQWVVARAATCRMRPVDYGRAQLLGETRFAARQSAGAAHLDPLFIAQLIKVGNNLNQVARQLNIFPEPAPPELATLLE